MSFNITKRDFEAVYGTENVPLNKVDIFVAQMPGEELFAEYSRAAENLHRYFGMSEIDWTDEVATEYDRAEKDLRVAIAYTAIRN